METEREDTQYLYKSLREMEDMLIELGGLMDALQQLEVESGAQICLTNILDEKLKCFQKHFYTHWDVVHEKIQGDMETKTTHQFITLNVCKFELSLFDKI